LGFNRNSVKATIKVYFYPTSDIDTIASELSDTTSQDVIFTPDAGNSFAVPWSDVFTPSNWELIDQQDEVKITNGHMNYSLSDYDKEGVIMVQALMTFGDSQYSDRYQDIRSDLVFSANPISAGKVIPSRIFVPSEVTSESSVS